jgi:hypothetical protein
MWRREIHRGLEYGRRREKRRVKGGGSEARGACNRGVEWRICNGIDRTISESILVGGRVKCDASCAECLSQCFLHSRKTFLQEPVLGELDETERAQR